METHYIYSAPGRTEIGGNHTDHQHGCVLAAAIDLETVADVVLNGGQEIHIRSEGYPEVSIALTDLSAREEERNTTAALVRGVAAAFHVRGAQLKGFDASIRSTVLPGSGLSSSAAFEVLLGTICNDLFFGNRLSAVEIAQIGQWAENVYFGKPCGLMDQMASSVGGLVYLDFADPERPLVEQVKCDFSGSGYTLCILDSGADHADLTEEYAAITGELGELCACFGKQCLREIPEGEFRTALPLLRGRVSDRAILRAIHVYGENRRVKQERDALKRGDLDAFFALCRQSGQSSWMYLQNIHPTGAVQHQEVAVTLALCDVLLQGRGAFRVHGGGFAGTVQAFVPNELLEPFKTEMEHLLGRGSCHMLKIHPYGGIRVGETTR